MLLADVNNLVLCCAEWSDLNYFRGQDLGIGPRKLKKLGFWCEVMFFAVKA